MVRALTRAAAIHRGRAAERLVDALYERSYSASDRNMDLISDSYWSVLPAPQSPEGEEQVQIRGAVLVRIMGCPGIAPAGETQGPEAVMAPAGLSPELEAALAEPPSRPGRELLKVLRLQGIPIRAALAGGLFLAAAGIVMEVALFQGLIGLGRDLGLFRQRLVALTAILLFMGALLFIEFPIATGTQRIGRRLEILLRKAFLEKIPRLNIRYFQSRPTSDMAERSHTMHHLRLLAPRGAQVVRFIFELILTTLGLIWLSPSSAPLAICLAAVGVAVPLFMQKPLMDRDLRVRTHAGALSRFYLDALLGAIPIRAHGIERAVRREHESLLLAWLRAGLSSQRAATLFEGMQALLGLGLASWLVMDYLGRAADPTGALLFIYWFIYWTLTLPIVGQEVAVAAREYPMYRNLTLRLLEPLGALEEENQKEEASEEPCAPEFGRGVAILFEAVTVRAGGHTILQDLDLEIDPGSHVAIVGHSGAGKSSLVGLLLGWHRPAEGRVLVNGAPLSGSRIRKLRAETVWIDPGVRLWNRSLLENLRYGYARDASVPPGEVIQAARLQDVLEFLPSGFQTVLGEGGSLVSGGEGQRVRFGRSLHRPKANLALLDEPFRGVGRKDRKELLAHARAVFTKATLLCVTQDISDSLDFDRVVVIHGGRIVESGHPGKLSQDPASRYAALLRAEKETERLWAAPFWKKIRLGRDRMEHQKEGGCDPL